MSFLERAATKAFLTRLRTRRTVPARVRGAAQRPADPQSHHLRLSTHGYRGYPPMQAIRRALPTRSQRGARWRLQRMGTAESRAGMFPHPLQARQKPFAHFIYLFISLCVGARRSITATRRSFQSTLPRTTSSRRLTTSCLRRGTRRTLRASRASMRSCSCSSSATAPSCPRRAPGSGRTRRRVMTRTVTRHPTYGRGRMMRPSCRCASSRSTRKIGLGCVRSTSVGVSCLRLATASTCTSPRSVGSRLWRSMSARLGTRRHYPLVFVPHGCKIEPFAFLCSRFALSHLFFFHRRQVTCSDMASPIEMDSEALVHG